MLMVAITKVEAAGNKAVNMGTSTQLAAVALPGYNFLKKLRGYRC
jgi:hypothetical protein